jgi:hypothetical protein
MRLLRSHNANTQIPGNGEREKKIKLMKERTGEVKTRSEE